MKRMRLSSRVNVKPRKVYIKNIDEWKGKSINLVLGKDDALSFAVGLIKSSLEADQIDVTIFPKARTPFVTVTYIKKLD